MPAGGAGMVALESSAKIPRHGGSKNKAERAKLPLPRAGQQTESNTAGGSRSTTASRHRDYATISLAGSYGVFSILALVCGARLSYLCRRLRTRRNANRRIRIRIRSFGERGTCLYPVRGQ